MSLKQSCFRSVYKSDIKRFWWISALFTLGMILIVGVPFFNYIDNRIIDIRGGFEPAYYFENTLDSYLYGNYVFAVAIGAFLSIGLFSYNSHVASVTFYHSMPIKRHKLMAAHALSAITLMSVPIVLNTIVCTAALRGVMSVKPVLISMCLYFVYALLAFSVFTFIGMLTGNVPSQSVFSVVFALIPFFIAFTASVMCENYLYGFHNNEKILDVMIDYFYLPPSELMTAKIFIYLFFIVLFYALAVFAYEKRNLENYGEVIAFPQFKGLFKVLFGICFGILGYFYCMEFWSIRNLLVMLLFGSLGVIIANMLANKSFSLKGTRNALICNAVFAAVMICVFRFDITGFEKRIPEVNEVAYAEILNYSDNGIVWSETDDGIYGAFSRTDYYTPKFSDKETIMKIIEFHKNAAEDKGESTYSMLHNELSDVPYVVSIRYTMKNGKTLSRKYNFDDKSANEFFAYIFETPEYLKYKYPVLDGTEKTYTSAVVWNNGYDGDKYDEAVYEESTIGTDDREHEEEYDDATSTLLTKSEDIKKLVEALKKDRENMYFEEYSMRRLAMNTCINIDLEYTVPAIFKKSGKQYNIVQSDSYSILPFDTNTIAFLRSKGICDADDLIQSDNIEKIVVNDWDIQRMLYEERDYYSDGKDLDRSEYPGKSAVFSSEEDIALFLNYYNETFENPANILDENVVKINFEVTYDNNTISNYTIIDDFDDLISQLKEIAELR